LDRGALGSVPLLMPTPAPPPTDEVDVKR
jgi:hypothetical protein